MPANADALHRYLLDGSSDELAPQLQTWLTTSRRFAGFAEAAKTKIRKKLRAARAPESVLDLQLELETAYLLLQERALGIVYEPQLSGQPRRPDFAVSFTTQTTFMLEVTRLQRTQTIKPERLAETICGKLGQLLPQRSNVLLVGLPAPISAADLRAVMVSLQGRAEHHDDVLLKRSQLRDWSAFFQYYRRLSEVLVCTVPRRSGGAPSVWVNPQAQQPLPRNVQSTLHRSQTV